MFGLGKLMAGKMGAGKLVLLAGCALLSGLVVTGVLAASGGLPGSGDGPVFGDEATADATSTPTPQPDGEDGVEGVGDAVDCPAGEETASKFEQNGREFEVTGL